MKKIFTILALFLGAITVSADDFTDVLSVDINGAVTEQYATISLRDSSNGKYIFSLKNFVLKADTNSIGVGTIELQDVEGVTDANGVLTLTTNQKVAIKKGDDPQVTTWIGPMLGNVPIELIAEKRDSTLYAVINIDMKALLDQIIKVTFGNGGYQIPNSGFETFQKYTVKTGGIFSPKDVDVYEATSWHSFATATGNFAATASLAASHPFTYQSSVTRPGSNGESSLLITSASAMGITANGTITTGRMNAGAMQAADPANHAFLDITNKDKDGKGDPFYTILNGRPDSIAVWVKFKQSSVQKDYPYATISAAVTNGSYYQDPQEKGKTYNNVLATAKNAKIESNGFAWQRISIPFEYINDTVKEKAILVTISTNAEPGKGTGNDSIFVDDAQLIYNGSVLSAKVKGVDVTLKDSVFSYTVDGLSDVSADDVEIITNANGAKIVKTLTKNGDDAVVNVRVASADLKIVSNYTFTMPGGAVTGIKNNKPNADDKVKAIYDILGRKVNTTKHGETYIIVYESGKTQKVVR